MTNFNRRRSRVRFNLKKRNKLGLYRVSVFRSNKNFYVQLIDSFGDVITSFSSLHLDIDDMKDRNGIQIANIVGINFAKLCLEKNIKNVVFDKSGYFYGGRVKAFADSCRESGMVF